MTRINEPKTISYDEFYLGYNFEFNLLKILEKRPYTQSQLADILSVNIKALRKCLYKLIQQKKIITCVINRFTYYGLKTRYAKPDIVKGQAEKENDLNSTEEILDFLKVNKEHSFKPLEISELTGINSKSIYYFLKKLFNDGKVTRVNNFWKFKDDLGESKYREIPDADAYKGIGSNFANIGYEMDNDDD